MSSNAQIIGAILAIAGLALFLFGARPTRVDTRTSASVAHVSETVTALKGKAQSVAQDVKEAVSRHVDKVSADAVPDALRSLVERQRQRQRQRDAGGSKH